MSSKNQDVNININCLKITFVDNEITICKLLLKIDYAKDVAEFKNSEHYTVYLFANEHLDVLRQHVEVVYDCGIRDPRHTLAHYLSSNKMGDKIPLIETAYNSEKRALYAIKVLFGGNGVEGRDTVNACIIGVVKIIFDKIWYNIDKECAGSLPGHVSELPGKEIDDTSLDSAGLRMLPTLEKLYGVSPELEKKYRGDSESARLVRVLILAAAKTQSPVLISGNTGTGKNVVAQAIHEHSSRKKFGLTVLNCGAIHTELMEFELFGCEKDYLFLGQPLRLGLWERAGNGSLFFDEIGALSLTYQVKIQRTLENGSFKRVGGTKEIKVHARVLAATNQNLFGMVGDGKFNAGLYYSLRSCFIQTLSLQDNFSDIPVLALFFWQKITGNSKASLPTSVLEELCRYAWPGNVWELKTLLARLFALFRHESPSLDELKDVFCLFGKTPLSTTRGLSKSSCSQKNIYLQHLKRFYELVDVWRHKIKQVLAELLKTKTSLSHAREVLNNILLEIDLLNQEPFLHQDQIFSLAVYEFRKTIYHLLKLLTSDKPRAIDYLETEVIKALDNLLSLIIREIKKLTDVEL